MIGSSREIELIERETNKINSRKVSLDRQEEVARCINSFEEIRQFRHV